MYKLNLPRISERIRGFTPPEDGVMFVFDYDEVFRITLGDPPSVETLRDNPYEFESNHPDHFGVSDKEPILESGSFKLSYQFDSRSNFQNITVESLEKAESIQFRTLSGDWFIATFSPCQKYLLIAEPYLIEVYSLQ